MIKVILHVVIVTVLTIISQIGGLVYLLALLTYRWINNKSANKVTRGVVKLLIFTGFYLAFTFLVVPFIAPFFGRVSLPVFETKHLKLIDGFFNLAF